MKDHITDILDNAPLALLNENDRLTISAHIKDCVACDRAFEAAQISALLVKARADEAADNAHNANPFFQTRVLAAWREQQAINKASGFRRLWSATGALVASMAATTAALGVLTFIAPATQPVTQQTAALVPYSAEAVVMDQSDNDQLTDDQVFSAIYADDDEGK